jgi:hypothetical protein
MNKKRSTAISRREFARRTALASAAASLMPRNALEAVPSSTIKQIPQQPEAPKLSPESQTEVEARAQVIVGQYGSRFTEDQKTDIHRLCAEVQPALDRLRAYGLQNGDGSALYLKPVVEREKKPATSSTTAKISDTTKP